LPGERIIADMRQNLFLSIHPTDRFPY
jgi:hypothetical protein